MSSPSIERSLSETLAERLRKSVGLPPDAGAILGSLLLEPDGAVSLERLERFLRRPIGRLGQSVDLLRRLGAIERGERRFPGWTRGTPGLRDLARRLAAAYRRGGMEALEGEHWRRREISPGYRRIVRILQAICPLDALAEFGAQLDRDLEDHPLWEASTIALSRLPDRWEIRISDEVREIAANRPLIVYGNHPSMLTPFLVAAALERDGLKFVSCRYVARLIPNVADALLPVDPTWERSSRNGWAGSLSHLLTLALLYRFDEPRDPRLAREGNRRSILAAAEHVLAGGASLIFPGGGGEKAWYPGLGLLVSEVLARDADEVYLLPVREENSSNMRLYRTLSRRGSPPRRLLRRPIRLTVGRPQALTSMASLRGSEPQQIVDRLRRRYAREFS